MLADLVFVDLASEHADLIEAFDSGEPAMDDWLRRHGVMTRRQACRGRCWRFEVVTSSATTRCR